MNRQHRVVMVILTGAVGLSAGLLVWSLFSSRDARPVSIQTADTLSPEQEILNDALRISTARQERGVRPFPYLPGSRPANLTHMEIGSNGDAVVDSYRVKNEDFSIFVAFSVAPTTLCENIRVGDVPGLCVRDQTVGLPPTDGTRYHHLTVYFTSRNGGALDAAEPGVAAARKYWRDVEMTPIDDTVWFNDLVARARAAKVK